MSATRPIHIEGMGVLGSILARHLEARGVPWTWSDNEDPHSAWRASTGLIYPDPEPRAAAALTQWSGWHALGLFASDELSPASYVYAQKAPPHGGKYATRVLGPGLTLALADCWQLNPARLVHRIRAAHAHTRLADTPSGVVVRAHAPIWKHTWGWSAPVQLDTSALPELAAPPAFIGRRISVNVYAYPVPGRPGWWRAGSALYDQTKPRSLDADMHLARWCQDFEQRFPAVPILAAERPVEGWRPRPHPDTQPTVSRDADGAYRVPALWHSGVRLAPAVIGELLDALELS